METFLLSLLGGIITAFIIVALLLKKIVREAVQKEVYRYQQSIGEQLHQQLEDYKDELSAGSTQPKPKRHNLDQGLSNSAKDIIKIFLDFNSESSEQYVQMMNEVANNSTDEIRAHALEQQITINKLISALEKRKDQFNPAIGRQIREIEKRLRRRYEELMELKNADKEKQRKLTSAKVEKFDKENRAFNRNIQQLFRKTIASH